MTKKNLHRLLTYVFLSIGGFLVIVIGVLLGKDVLIAIGGALGGVGTSMLMGFLLGTELEDYSKLLSKGEMLASNPEKAKVCAGVWYLYHTTMKSTDRLWMYYKFKLELDTVLGTLHGRTKTLDKNGKTAIYYIDAIVRGDRLFLVGRPKEGAEAHYSASFPKAADKAVDKKCGVKFHQDWNGNTAISPCLLSRNKLIETRGLRKLTKEEQGELNNMWCNEAQQQNVECLVKCDG